MIATQSLGMLALVNITGIMIPVAILLVVVAVILVLKAAASRYIKVGPDEIAVFSGRKYKWKAPDGTVQTRGFHILTGGGRICMPVVEQVRIVPISAFQVEVEETKIPNQNNVAVNIQCVATCRLSTNDEDMANAVGNFLSKTPEEQKLFIQNILRGHLRSIVGNLSMDQLLRERSKLNDMVVTESTAELKRLGIQLITLVIQDIRDDLGFIEALGKQQVANTMRDANIAVAEADRETSIKTSNARKEAAEVEAANAALVADAQKKRDVQVAEFRKQTETAKAIADNAFGIANAEQQAKLKVAEANRDMAEKEAQALVEEKEKVRRQLELQATVITEAEATRQAAVIKAEADKQVATLEAERAAIQAQGIRNAAIQTGEGEAQKTKLIADATAEQTRKVKTAEADGEKAKLLAQAEGEKAKLLAEAEGEKAKQLASAAGLEATKLAEALGVQKLVLAQAEGKRQSLLAEAEGTDKLAEALQKLSEQGKLMLVLDRLPKLVQVGGEAGEKIAAAIFANVAKGVERIGTVTITDLGGGNTAKNGISGMMSLVPQIVMEVVAGLKARGIDPTELLKLLKLDGSTLSTLVGTPVQPVTGEASKK